MCAALARIISLAPSLSHAELRVLLDLAGRMQSEGSFEVKASSRQLVESTGLVRASVQAAIDSLHQSGFIQTRQPSRTATATHLIVCLLGAGEQGGPTVEPQVAQKMSHSGLIVRPAVAHSSGQGGLAVGPELAQKECQGGLIFEPLVAHKLGHGGLNSEPAVNGKSVTCAETPKENAHARADSTDFDIEKMIDRLQNAKKADFDDSLFETARQQIAGHHAKFCRPENRLSSMPDDAITAQFLSVAQWPRLDALLSELASERTSAVTPKPANGGHLKTGQ